MIKQMDSLGDVEKSVLENILSIIINKTQYDDNYSFEHSGEDEAIFDEYRKSLKVVFDNVAGTVPDLVLKVN